MKTRVDPMESLNALHEAGQLYAQAKAERIYVEEFRKTLKAKLMKSCGESAIGAQEREAYAHQDYADHLQALREAVEQEERLRWRLITAQAAVEVWRSTEASNRVMDRSAA